MQVQLGPIVYNCHRQPFIVLTGFCYPNKDQIHVFRYLLASVLVHSVLTSAGIFWRHAFIAPPLLICCSLPLLFSFFFFQFIINLCLKCNAMNGWWEQMLIDVRARGLLPTSSGHLFSKLLLLFWIVLRWIYKLKWVTIEINYN